MSVYELTRNQLIQLKQDYLCSTQKTTYMSDLADADILVSDKTIFDAYGHFNFTTDDFI